MPMSLLWWVLCHPEALAVAEYLNHDLGKVSEWCDLWGMKMNASNNHDSLQVRHNASPVVTLTINGTVLEESDDLYILLVTFDSKVTYDIAFHSICTAASRKLGISKKSWRVFNDRLLFGRCCRDFVLLVSEYCSSVRCSLPITP